MADGTNEPENETSSPSSPSPKDSGSAAEPVPSKEEQSTGAAEAAGANAESKTRARRTALDRKDHFKEPFLEAFKATRGKKLLACERVGISDDTVNRWRQRDRSFDARYKQLEIDLNANTNESLEATAENLAIIGSPIYLIQNGQNVLQRDEEGKLIRDAKGNPIPVVLRREHDSRVLIFLLARRPGLAEKYRDQIEIQVNGEIVHTIVGEVGGVIRKNVVDFCPNCKFHLGLTPKIVEAPATRGEPRPSL